MLDWYPPTSDDVGPTAKVGGFSRLAGLGEWLPPGTLWMVLRRWSNFHWFPFGLRGSIKFAGFVT